MRVPAERKRIKVVLPDQIVFFFGEPKVPAIRLKQRRIVGKKYKVGNGVLVKMSDMVLQKFAAVYNVPQVSSLLGRDDTKSLFQSKGGRYRMRRRAYTAYSFRKIYRIHRRPAFEHHLEPAKKQTFRFGIDYNLVLYICFDLHEPADARDRIDYNLLHGLPSPFVVS